VSDAPGQAMERLLEVMARLRDPAGGCPWDLEQDFATIAPYTVEEAYEVADAIARGDMESLKDELGDLLLQVVYHAQMAKEQGSFDFAAVAAAIADKMVRRHPHVFGEAQVESASAQRLAWEEVKAAERERRGGAGLLDDVPVALPALTRAVKLQRRAARGGFDWPDAEPVLDKIAEEVGELRAELSGPRDAGRLEDELGDLLFALVNLARHLDVDPEAALARTNRKFERRFRRIEQALAADGRSVHDTPLTQLEALWQQAKAGE
jgi:nucleoside triphosphate diphosphatase